ncbi:ribosomal protein L34e [Rhizoctonia solani]|uniref:Ribosomal protein L34e n=2 Tax=Rhizoctonia solani TaxID=456999 RepID=A0A8H8P954_9AGAM|nr:ribosomal protein L34e [Rhizoctonia solani]QRW26091.1 ribosomal protein L34e [Rhizoctonia solani]
MFCQIEVVAVWSKGDLPMIAQQHQYRRRPGIFHHPVGTAPDANQFTSEPTHNLKTVFEMAQRVTIRKRTPYNTKSNRRRVVKTPGGKLVYQHLKKLATSPKCGDCGTALPGVPALRPREYATISKRQKTVRRAYGGSRCGDCVKQRILRAFLIEEAKIVKKVIKSQEKGAPRK